jgi:hypothetical protein
MSGFRSRVSLYLGEHDAMLAQCPVNNPKRGIVFRPDDACPRCRAKASGSCGLASSAGYHLASSIRRALLAEAVE